MLKTKLKPFKLSNHANPSKLCKVMTLVQSQRLVLTLSFFDFQRILWSNQENLLQKPLLKTEIKAFRHLNYANPSKLSKVMTLVQSQLKPLESLTFFLN